MVGVVVNGSRPVIDGGGFFQLLTTQVRVEVNVSNIDFVNGMADGNGGALQNDGTMRLHHCTLSYNWAVGAGGALQNTGELELEHVSFDNNHASDAGALSSTGTAKRRTSLRAFDVNFTHNWANQSGGALLNDQGDAYIHSARFTHHAVFDPNTVGGTLFNGRRSYMRLTDAYVAHSFAGSGGLLTNEGTLDVLRVDFQDGTATNSDGGAVSNKGQAFFTECSFRETRVQNREDPTRYVQGATLSMTEVNASTTMLNCTIDGGSTKAQPSDGSFRPSELYVSASGTLLNLTFTNITNCHPGGGPRATDPSGGNSGVLLLEAPGTPKHPDRKVVVRGSHVCEDGSYTKLAINAQTLKFIAGCADAPWQCGDRAHCTELEFGVGHMAGRLGVACACGAHKPVAHTSSPSAGVRVDELSFDMMGDVTGDAQWSELYMEQEQAGSGLPASPPPPPPPLAPITMWGFPYGGGPTIPNSEGFAGCFEQWDDRLGALSATGCAITPPFDGAAPGERTSYACCALRNAADVTAPVLATVVARPYARDHVGLAGLAGGAPSVTEQVHVSPKNPSSALNATTRSFDQNHSVAYVLNVSYLPGDVHCTPGTSSSCYYANGTERLCLSQTKYPVHELQGKAKCNVVHAGSDAATACGYAAYGAVCDCPVCKPNAKYACDCPNSTDGTGVCAIDGESLTCDCNTPYAFYPPSPPNAPLPPPPASASAAVPIVASLAGVLLLGAGGGLLYRRSALRRQSTLREMQAGLLGSEHADDRPNTAINALDATESSSAPGMMHPRVSVRPATAGST